MRKAIWTDTCYFRRASHLGLHSIKHSSDGFSSIEDIYLKISKNEISFSDGEGKAGCFTFIAFSCHVTVGVSLPHGAWVCLQCVAVTFPGHTHFNGILKMFLNKSGIL